MINPDTQEAREHSGLLSYTSLKLLWDNVVDLIFPHRCQHCGRVDTPFCETCTNDLSAIPLDIIMVDVPPMISVISSGLHVGLLRSTVQALKYTGQRQLGAVLAKRLVPLLDDTNWRFDTIIPVPLHSARLQERGYNQAKEISIHLANLLNSQHRDDILIRHSQTQSQVGLNQDERIENVKEAFQVTSNLEGATVLLVDDVRTTGATITSCAEVLLENGAKAVYGITVTAAGRL